MFFTKGVGHHKEYLQSFEMALRDAGIAEFNLVHVSSIFPPNCRRVTKEEGKKYLSPGQVVFCVMARNATNEPNRLVAASIGLAQPAEVHNALDVRCPGGLPAPAVCILLPAPCVRSHRPSSCEVRSP